MEESVSGNDVLKTGEGCSGAGVSGQLEGKQRPWRALEVSLRGLDFTLRAEVGEIESVVVGEY